MNNKKGEIKSSRLVTTEANFQTLVNLVNSTSNNLIVISPWIQISEIVEILKYLKSEQTLTIITRWPKADELPRYIDVDAWDYAFRCDKVSINWLIDKNDLHAKVYYVKDRGGLITSGNFTQYGFPHKEHRKSNIELGVLIQDSDNLEQLEDWIEELEYRELREEELSILIEWKELYLKWSGTHPFTPPPLTQPIWDVRRASIAALESIKADLRSGLKDFKHIALRKKRAAFMLDIGGKKNFAARVITSVKNPEGKYHYQIAKHDIKAWYQTRATNDPWIRGVILVPVIEEKDQPKMFNEKAHPPVLLPFDYLIRKDNLTKSNIFDETKANQTSTLYVQNTNGQWQMEYVTKRMNIPIDIKRCLGRATQMKDPEIWRSYRSRYLASVRSGKRP